MELFSDYRNDVQVEPSASKVNKSLKPWRVLIVDDDDQVHQITKLALSGFTFQERKLELVSALSGEEAKQILDSADDIAIALVDVVMETEHAGLDLVRHIREGLNNKLIRLVLRTGQAGQAPEDIIIQEYEIDDYKEKTELTTQKLRTLLYSMLRAYRDLCLIDKQREGLRLVIQASANVQNTTTMKAYAAAALLQATSLLKLDVTAFYGVVQPTPEAEGSSALTLAATGGYVNAYSECAYDRLPDIVSKRFHDAAKKKQSQSYEDAYVFFMADERGVNNLLYININTSLSELDKQLLEIYMHNIGLTFENLGLLVDLKETAKELVYNLANAVEARSKETGAHVQRVSLVSEQLAILYGLSEYDTLMIKQASPLHDVGKVAIPDRILHKPGKLTEDEWQIMQKHVEYGVDILSRSKRKLILVAKEIAAYHHEKWDGTGYPYQLSGEDIPISGRITALADVFDALGAKRSYKKSWPDEEIRKEILSQKGKHFEPVLVDLMLDNWDMFVEIRDSLPD